MTIDTQEVAPEQTQNAPETDTPELVTPDEQTAEASAEDTQEDATAKAESDPVAKLQARFDRRIGRATAARYQAEARAEQAEREAAEARALIAQLRGESGGEQPQITPDKVLPIAQQLAAQIREREKMVESVRAVLDKGKALEGFNEACNAVDAEVSFYDRQGAPTPFLRSVMECADPARVLHYLGQNPERVADIADLTPTQQARRLDRIEAELNKPAESKTSNAPKPIAPVKGAGSGNKDPSRMTDHEFAAWRHEQIKARRGY